MATMRALLKTGAEQAEIADVPRPEPAAREVLVRIHACAICASDLPGWQSPDVGDRTRRGWNPSHPGMTGHELSGEIVAVGDGVSAGRIGERVWMDPIVGCGECPPCREQKYTLCRRATVVCNGYAEYVCAPSSQCVPVPAGVSLEAASMIADMLGTPMGAVRRAAVRPDERVAVWGLGPVGLGLVQGARIHGAACIVGVDLYDNRRAMAFRLGATHTLDPRTSDPVRAIRELTDGEGVDVVLHSVSAATAAAQAFESLRLEGRMVTLAGHPPAGGQTPKTVTGNWGCYHADFPAFLELLTSGRFVLEPYITHTYSLHKAAEAFQTRLHRPESSLKVIVEMR
jgi:threonine dehydrogenase-like Zn-dependent dehydrogenase